MDERRETIADITAEMRGLVKPGETLEHTYELLNGLAVRIEAAHKREVDALIAKLDEARHCWKVWSERADELLTKCDEQYAKLKTIGNGAKMREALLALDAWAKVVKNIPKDTTAIECAEFVKETIRVALAEPPRNCDVGTVADQARRYRAFCERHRGCDECYIELGGETFDCEFAWAQMPYKEGGEE